MLAAAEIADQEDAAMLAAAEIVSPIPYNRTHQAKLRELVRV